MIKMKFGIESLAVHNGHHAIKMVQKEIEAARKSSPPNEELDAPFKIIFMDCNMPEMDGFETTQKILDICQHEIVEKPYIVALTAYSNDDKNMKQQCYQNGMNQILSKPINLEIIKELLIRVNVDFKVTIKDKKE